MKNLNLVQTNFLLNTIASDNSATNSLLAKAELKEKSYAKILEIARKEESEEEEGHHKEGEGHHKEGESEESEIEEISFTPMIDRSSELIDYAGIVVLFIAIFGVVIIWIQRTSKS